MNFYVITDHFKSDVDAYLQQAAEQRSIPFQSIGVESFDYVIAPKILPGDLLYRTSNLAASVQVESFLYTDSTATFFRGYPKMPTQHRWSHLLCHSYQIPMPKTLFSVSTERKIIDSAVEYLGGYPIIIKALGGSHGIGVIRADSAPALYAIIDYMNEKNGGEYILREYIPANSHARLIVLGDVVIDSIEYKVQGNDFRTNVGEPIVQSKQFSKDIEKIAVDVVSARGVEFGGVDIIFDRQGNPYVLEVNFPCYFPRAQAVTGTDIAGQMIDYLLKKSQIITQ